VYSTDGNSWIVKTWPAHCHVAVVRHVPCSIRQLRRGQLQCGNDEADCPQPHARQCAVPGARCLVIIVAARCIAQWCSCSVSHAGAPHASVSLARASKFLEHLLAVYDGESDVGGPLWAYHGGLPPAGKCAADLSLLKGFDFSRKEDVSPWSVLPIWSMLPTASRTDESLPESSVDCRGTEFFGKSCVFNNVCYHKQQFWCALCSVRAPTLCVRCRCAIRYTAEFVEDDQIITQSQMFDIAEHDYLVGSGAVRANPFGADVVVSKNEWKMLIQKPEVGALKNVQWVMGTTLWATDMVPTSTFGHPLEFASKLPGLRKLRFPNEPIDQIAVRYTRQHKVACAPPYCPRHRPLAVKVVACLSIRGNTARLTRAYPADDREHLLCAVHCLQYAAVSLTLAGVGGASARCVRRQRVAAAADPQRHRHSYDRQPVVQSVPGRLC
jgi:hypothetical protein